MITLVVYDIPSDDLRPQVAEACLDLGLRRIQYSAFLGFLPRARKGELQMRIRRILGSAPANVRFFPMCARDFALADEISLGDYDPW